MSLPEHRKNVKVVCISYTLFELQIWREINSRFFSRYKRLKEILIYKYYVTLCYVIITVNVYIIIFSVNWQSLRKLWHLLHIHIRLFVTNSHFLVVCLQKKTETKKKRNY